MKKLKAVGFKLSMFGGDFRAALYQLLVYKLLKSSYANAFSVGSSFRSTVSA